MGGGGGPGWCDKHIKAIMNISPAFLGVPKVVSNVFSAEGNDVSFVRAAASGFINFDYLGLQMIEHVMRVCRTWDSIISLMPKGGETIWGDLDWSPEEGNNNCDQEFQRKTNSGKFNSSSEDVWTEYDEMSRESIQKVAEEKVYTARTVFDLLNYVAPKMMKRAEAHFSHGIAEDLDDPKYAHYKYWSNPLETKLPDAPDMEMYCLYGVGIPTERSHVYKLSLPEKCNKTIPFQIDPSADGEQGNTCLQNGVYFVDDDQSVPVVSAGFMCAKGWRGRTRFNPSGMDTYVSEYRQRQHGSVLDGRGLESGGGGNNIMGNVALVEDVLRVAAGATGVDIGGDRIVSDIIKISERINLRL